MDDREIGENSENTQNKRRWWVAAISYQMAVYGGVRTALRGQDLFRQVQQIIERYQLYPDPKRARRQGWKRLPTIRKKRITKLIKEPKTGFLVGIDTLIPNQGRKRFYMLTALDAHSRWGIRPRLQEPQLENGGSVPSRPAEEHARNDQECPDGQRQ